MARRLLTACALLLTSGCPLTAATNWTSDMEKANATAAQLWNLQTARAFAALAKLSYCGPGPWELPPYGTKTGFRAQSRTCPQCEKAGFLLADVVLVPRADEGMKNADFAYVGQLKPVLADMPPPADCVVVFRGTWVNPANSVATGDTSLVDFTTPSCKDKGCQVVGGAFGIWTNLKEGVLSGLVRLGCGSVAVTGHSLGGQITPIAMMSLQDEYGYQVKLSYTFEAPKPFNSVTSAVFEELFRHDREIALFRITHTNDMICRYPKKHLIVPAGFQVWFYGSGPSDEYVFCGHRRDCGIMAIPRVLLCNMKNNSAWKRCGPDSPYGGPHCEHPLAPARSFCAMGGNSRDVFLWSSYDACMNGDRMPSKAQVPTSAPGAWPLETLPEEIRLELEAEGSTSMAPQTTETPQRTDAQATEAPQTTQATLPTPATNLASEMEKANATAKQLWNLQTVKAFAALAKLAYCGPGPWELPPFGTKLGFVEQSRSCPQCEEAGFELADVVLVARKDEGMKNADFAYVGQLKPVLEGLPTPADCVVVFRGTWVKPANNVATGDTSLVNFTTPSCKDKGCKVVGGAFGIWTQLKDGVLDGLARFGCGSVAVTGHSLGGQITPIAMMSLQDDYGYKVKLSYTFEAPKPFNSATSVVFEELFRHDREIALFRITHTNDKVCRNPNRHGIVPAGFQVWFYGSGPSDEYVFCGQRRDCGIMAIPRVLLCGISSDSAWKKCGPDSPYGGPHCEHPLAPARSFCAMGGNSKDVFLWSSYAACMNGDPMPGQAQVPTSPPGVWPLKRLPEENLLELEAGSSTSVASQTIEAPQRTDAQTTETPQTTEAPQIAELQTFNPVAAPQPPVSPLHRLFPRTTLFPMPTLFPLPALPTLPPLPTLGPSIWDPARPAKSRRWPQLRNNLYAEHAGGVRRAVMPEGLRLGIFGAFVASVFVLGVVMSLAMQRCHLTESRLAEWMSRATPRWSPGRGVQWQALPSQDDPRQLY